MKDKMTVKEFLERGYKFVEGDMITLTNLSKVTFTQDTLGTANQLLYDDDARFVISAKALEPKRVNVSYEKVSFDKLSEAFAEHEKSPLYHDFDDAKIQLTEQGLFSIFNTTITLYRKVETTITQMQAAKDACEKFIDSNIYIQNHNKVSTFVAKSVDDLALNYDKEYIKMCRAIINAYDGVNK